MISAQPAGRVRGMAESVSAAQADRILIDTNIAIFLAQGREYANRYRRHVEGRVVCLSFASVAEVLFTAQRAGNPERALAYWRDRLPYYVVLYPDLELCKVWAAVVSNLRGKGISLQDNDL